VALSFAIEDKGILPDRMIAALAAGGGILPATDFVPDQIQPASLDLRLGEVAYRVARQLPARIDHGCPAHRRIEAARIRAHRRRGVGNRLRLYRAAMESLALPTIFPPPPIRKARPAGSMCSPV